MPYKDKNKFKRYLKTYKKRNREQIRKTARDYMRRLRIHVIDKYGGCCNSCGISDIRVLQIDHVDGGGTKERKSISNRMLLLKLKRENKSNKYQILCANCNTIKRIVNNE